MRTLVSIFLLAIFAVPFFWGPSWLSMEKRQIQKNVRNFILPSVDESELIIFEVSTSDTTTHFKWKHSKEFEYQGKMYDIVKRKQTGDEITYLVWQDDEETVINSKIKQLTNSIFNNSSESQNNQLSFQLLVTSLFVEPPFNFTSSYLYSSKTSAFYHYQNTSLIQYKGAIFNPPQV